MYRYKKRKDEDVPEEVTLAKKILALKEFSKIFRNIGNTKDKIMKAYLHLERGVTIGPKQNIGSLHSMS